MYEELAAKITEISGIPAETTKVWKNGVQMDGIVMGDGQIRPTIYPKNIDGSIDEVARKAIEIYEKNKDPNMGDVTDFLTDFQRVKDHLEICLCPVNADEKRLKRNFLDLEEYVRVRISAEASSVVTKAMVKQWGVDENDVWNAAKCKDHKFMSMEQMLMETMLNKRSVPCDEIPQTGMIVCTNDSRCYGATAMLDNDMLSRISDIMESDLYIIPSSIHEIIVLRVNDGANVDDLRQMINEVNGSVVSPEERLSDSLYIFKAGKLSIAA